MTPQETRLRDVATPSEAEAYLRAFVALIERPRRVELRVDADVGDKVAAYLTALLSEVDRLRGERDEAKTVAAASGMLDALRTAIPLASHEIEALAEKWPSVVQTMLKAERDAQAAEAQADQHRARAERLAATLRFYASKNAWRSATVYMCGHSAPSQAVLDGGRRALRALSQEGEG